MQLEEGAVLNGTVHMGERAIAPRDGAAPAERAGVQGASPLDRDRARQSALAAPRKG
jgi:hypothetical protein